MQMTTTASGGSAFDGPDDDWHPGARGIVQPPGAHERHAAPPSGSEPDRPGRRSVLCTGAAVVGALVTAAALVVNGPAAVMSQCEGAVDNYDERSDMCVRIGAYVPFLELAIVAISVLAPLAGCVLTCRHRNVLWIVGGVAVAASMTALTLLLAGQQASILR